MTGCRAPCKSCPWRREAHAGDIPGGFSLVLAEGLAATSPDEHGFGPELASPQFACHQSRDGDEVVCAGWLAAVGNAHPAVKVAVLRGTIHPSALQPRPGLHETFAEVIEKLREDVAQARGEG